MKFFQQSILLVFLSIMLTSCFEIKEEVNMDADGTGDLKLVINLSESKDQVKKYLDVQAQGNGFMPKDKNVESILKHVQVVLESVKGLSDVSIERDYTDFIFTANAHFENISVINTAVTTLSKQLDYLYIPPMSQKSFVHQDNEFTRLFDYPIQRDEWDRLPSFAKYALESAKVISVYRFSKEIQSYSNKTAQISPSKKAIKLVSSVSGIATGKETMANKITF